MSYEGAMDDLEVKNEQKRGLPGPPRHVEMYRSTCPLPLYPKMKKRGSTRGTLDMSRCPVRHVECPSANQTHFSKTDITWARKLEITRRLLCWNPNSKGYPLI